MSGRRGLIAILALATIVAGPATALAHGLAHRDAGPLAHQHVRALHAHEHTDGGPHAEAADHQHGRLDQSLRSVTWHLAGAVPAVRATPDAGVLPAAARPADRPAAPPPDPYAGSPPNLRSPPSR